MKKRIFALMCAGALVLGMLTGCGGGSSSKPAETKAAVAYLPDRDFLPGWMKVSELIGMYADFYKDFDREKAERLLLELKLDKNMRLAKMSKGMKEKVQLVMVMSRRAKIYILDEPLGGVDPASRDYILKTILKNFGLKWQKIRMLKSLIPDHT